MALIGFLFVWVFFFFSGYGLFKSYRTKPDYLNGFLRNRLPVVLVPLYIVNTILTIITLASNSQMYNDMNPIVMGFDNVFFRITTFLGITLMNSNAWYMITITMFYIAFYVSFKKCKDENKAFKVMGIFSAVYIIVAHLLGHGIFWLQGEWWYDSSILFFIGMYVAKNEKNVIAYVKKRYAMLLTLCGIGTVILTIVSIMANVMISYYQPGIVGRIKGLACLITESSAVILFVAFILILTMKVKFSNVILDFLGRNALEIYLVHRFFIVCFNSIYINISNRILYLGAVYICAILSAVILHKVDNVIVKAIRKKNISQLRVENL